MITEIMISIVMSMNGNNLHFPRVHLSFFKGNIVLGCLVSILGSTYKKMWKKRMVSIGFPK